MFPEVWTTKDSPLEHIFSTIKFSCEKKKTLDLISSNQISTEMRLKTIYKMSYKTSGFLLLLRKDSTQLSSLPENVTYCRGGSTQQSQCCFNNLCFHLNAKHIPCLEKTNKQKRTTLLSIALVSQYSARLHWAGQCIHYINTVFKWRTQLDNPIVLYQHYYQDNWCAVIFAPVLSGLSSS